MPPHTASVDVVLRRMMHDLVEQVLDTEASALADEPDGVHHHRTKVRRLRGTIAATRTLLEAATTAPVEVSMREWGRQLGEVRDAEVRAQIAAEAQTAAQIDDDAVWDRLVHDQRAEYDRLHARLQELHALPRAERRASDLRQFGTDPRITEPDADAADVFTRLLRREARRVRRAAKRVDNSSNRYHDLRKAGRRLRYLADAVDKADPELFGASAKRLSKAGRRVHDVLGDHRDALMFVERLEHERARAMRAGEATEPYNRMIAAATARADARLAKLPSATKRVRKAAAALH